MRRILTLALWAGTDDARQHLTWRNVFAQLDVGTNFYSSGEEVLANPDPGDDGVPVLDALRYSGRHAWIVQEKVKGGTTAGLADIFAIQFLRSWTGGWVGNTAWYVPIVPAPPAGSPQIRRRFMSEVQNTASPAGVPTSALTSEPFFRRFQASESDGFYPGYQGSRLHAPGDN